MPLQEPWHCRALSPPLYKALLCLESGMWRRKDCLSSPSWLLAQQPQHSSPGMMLWHLGALSLCFTLLLSPFLLSREVLRAIPATGNGSHRHCHFPGPFPTC